MPTQSVPEKTPDHFRTPSTPEERREVWRRRGISLEHHFGWPVGWGLLADEAEHLQRLGQFVREYHSSVWPRSREVEEAAELAGEPLGWINVDLDGLIEAVEPVLTRVQRELAGRVGTSLGIIGVELAKARWGAIEALIWQYGHRGAKKVQADLSLPGPPLAICVGKGYRLVSTVAGRIPLRPIGCWCVFEDASYGRGDMWPHWCPEHQASKPGRDQAREVVRRVRRIRGSVASARVQDL